MCSSTKANSTTSKANWASPADRLHLFGGHRPHRHHSAGRSVATKKILMATAGRGTIRSAARPAGGAVAQRRMVCPDVSPPTPGCGSMLLEPRPRPVGRSPPTSRRRRIRAVGRPFSSRRSTRQAADRTLPLRFSTAIPSLCDALAVENCAGGPSPSDRRDPGREAAPDPHLEGDEFRGGCERQAAAVSSVAGSSAGLRPILTSTMSRWARPFSVPST